MHAVTTRYNLRLACKPDPPWKEKCAPRVGASPGIKAVISMGKNTIFDITAKGFAYLLMLIDKIHKLKCSILKFELT